ncbi:hypothetical protein GQ53DRAFT_661656 [Thozetella sp. PMI_491]|nr:hypothetical protein GQ53DRAFT_661656 [Thozetella sp. PMI_491]
MLSSSKGAFALKVAAPLLAFIWSFLYFTRHTSPYHDVLRTFKDQKTVFVADFLENEIDGSFNGSGIARLCASKQWTPNLYLSCASAYGGISQVKNAHLTCFRVAIEMGAELILPRVVERNSKDITKTTPNGGKGPMKSTSLEHFFDQKHLEHALSTSCPQMKVHQSMDDLWDVPSLLNAVRFKIMDTGIPMTNGVISDVSNLGGRLQAFVLKHWPKEKRPTPIHFELDLTWFSWPVTADEPAVAQNFGRILRIREDARQLAASALFNMKKLFTLSLDPRKGIHQRSFVGVHLRTERDIISKDFPPYETQAAYYLDYITRSKIPLAYMATGATQENITAFAERAKDFNVTVVQKTDILEGEDLNTLYGMSWDQRALVDYEIMLRAGLVAGVAESSFAWNLALRRRNTYGGFGSPEHKSNNSYVQWQDQYSVVFGKSPKGQRMMRTIWP